MRTLEPSFGAIFSRPWAAHEAGSRRVASMSDKFLILKTLLFQRSVSPLLRISAITYPAGYAQYSAKPPSMVTPCASNYRALVNKVAMSLDIDITYFLAKQELTSATVETLIAKLRVICNYSLSDLESLETFDDGFIFEMLNRVI